MDKDEFTQHYRPEHGVMRVRVEGIFPKSFLERKGNIFQPLIEACEQANCRTALIDARNLKVDLDTLAVFRAGVDAASVSRHRLRLAFVARKENLDSFFEDVVINRGAGVEVFTEMEDAMKWVNGS
jgi:hypothetical protein